ncbi:hypothetical protein EJ110_NYTH15638 [Nymphaea thermarum]|nr:hypothetical protein EJ110_NYTH15638 [Nymphaea thermarum]
MSDLVSSAVVGSVVAELLKATLEAGKATKNFRAFMGQSQRTVEYLQVALENVKQLEEQHGISLIDKCSKLSSWNIWKRYTYAKKLMKLDTVAEVCMYKYSGRTMDGRKTSNGKSQGVARGRGGVEPRGAAWTLAPPKKQTTN